MKQSFFLHYGDSSSEMQKGMMSKKKKVTYVVDLNKDQLQKIKLTIACGFPIWQKK